MSYRRVWGFEAILTFQDDGAAVAAALAASGEQWRAAGGLDGRRVGALKRLRTVVTRRRRAYFSAESEDLSVHFCGIRNYEHSLLSVESATLHDWRVLALNLAPTGSFVLARSYNVHHDHWQNASDPLEFEVVGQTITGLPMRDNGLPPPLARLMVDTSQNPGRRVLRDGYVEAVGHAMWLGPGYFLRVPGADIAAIMSADGLRVSELASGLVEIVASEEPFTDDTPDGIQEGLRRLLFPTTS